MTSETATRPLQSELKPDEAGFRYILMWMKWLIDEGESADQSYLLEWRGFVEQCSTQRTALLYCYEKLQPMQPFEEWVKEIGK